MRSLILSIVAATLLMLLPGPPADAFAGSAVVELGWGEYHPNQRLVTLKGGREAGVNAGDPFWVIGESGVVAGGEIILVMPDKSAGRLTGESPGISNAARVVAMQRPLLPELRDRMPPGATVSGKILRLPPGRHTAWIDIHEDSGLRLGDSVLVSRRGIPISKGRLGVLEREAALVTLEPLVSNALPEPGDRVELWPAPADARWGRLNTTILRVTEGPQGTLNRVAIEIAGTAENGLAVDRLVDVYRGRQYVGMGSMVQVSSPNSKAQMFDVATATRPAEGDRAVVRAPLDAPPGPLTVPVFKVDQDFCLIGAGELDGIKIGEKFLVRRRDPDDVLLSHDVALLTVDYLAPAHCGAKIKPLSSDVPGVRVWDLAERQVDGLEQWRAVGIVERVEALHRTAVVGVAPGCGAAPGSVVGWVPEPDVPPGAAIVLCRDNDRLIIHVPAGWGDVELLGRALVLSTAP